MSMTHTEIASLSKACYGVGLADSLQLLQTKWAASFFYLNQWQSKT